jgi:hypothetical protein
MPTVPKREDQSLVPETMKSILGTRGVGWPIGMKRTLREEIARQTEAAQDPPAISGFLRARPEAWQKFIKESPKASDAEERPKPTGKWPTPQVRQDVMAEHKRLDKAFMAKPEPGPVSPMAQALGQGSMKGIATERLGLNEQEQFLYQHHLDNLAKGGVSSAGGKTSSLLAITVGQDDKTSIIPTIWDNKIVSKDQAIANADKVGFDKFPSYDSREEAFNRYMKMHDYMDKDMQ